MLAAPRILFVADPSTAVDLLGVVRTGGEVKAQLAPTADALRQALMEPDAAETWSAVLFVPGGPVEEVEVAVFVPDGVPLLVAGDEVPLLLSETSAVAVPASEMGGLLSRLAAMPRPSRPEPLDLAIASDEPQPASDEPADAFSMFEDVDLGPAPGTAPLAGAEPHPEPAPVEVAQGPAPADPAPADSLERLASLADHLPIGLYRSTRDGRILYANPALAHLLGAASVGALSALDVRTDLGYPREAFAEEMARSGAVRNLVQTWTRADGRRIATRENARVVTGPGGEAYYEGTMEDVTAEQEARAEEQAAARQHRAVAGFAASAALADAAATIHCAAAGALLDATEADWACLVTRVDGQSRIAASAGQFQGPLAPAVENGVLRACFPPDASVVARRAEDLGCAASYTAALAGVSAFPLASVPVRKAGQPLGQLVWGRAAGIEASAVRAAEALAWHVGSHIDRAEAMRELRDSEASLAVIAETTAHVFYRLCYSPDGAHFEYLSPAIEGLLGMDRAEIEARGGVGAFVEHRDVLEGDGLTVGPVEGASQYRACYRMRTAHGPRWIENHGRPWRDDDGRPVGLMGVFQDVTERKRREDRLADAAQAALIRQRALVDLAHIDGTDGFGPPAAAVAAATLGASAVSLWRIASGRPAEALAAPPREQPVPIDAVWHGMVAHVERHRALAIDDVREDRRIDDLGLRPFVQAFGLTALLVAPIRRQGVVEGVVVVHHAEGPHAWDAGETEFAAAVADAVALALERQEREEAAAALSQAREAAEAGLEAAERLNRLRASFLANMSHEIRTPLTGILGFADLLADEVDEPQREFVDLIDRNGHRLLETLDAVLDLSRLEAGEFETHAEPMALAPLVEQACERAAAEARTRGLRFDLDLDPHAAAQVDASALRQAVAHLAGNAVRFTDSGGVFVAVEASPTDVSIRVADTGAGISPEFLPEATEAFRQEDAGHTRRHEGAGLGLTLASRLVDLLGGSLELASERPGGTVATITFPRVAVAVPAEAPAEAPSPVAVPSGDGLATLLPEVAPALAAAPEPATDAGDLFGDPFDFSFLDTPDSLPDAPMFDFRFGRPDASEAGRAASSDRPAAPAPPASRPAPEPPAAPTLPPDQPVMIVRARPDVSGPTIPEAVPPAEDADVVGGGDRQAVLVVEDNDDTRMLLERILRSAYDVVAVGDARSALLAMNQRRFAGLVLDINLGGKETGADVLRIARSLPRYDDVFAIALTAYALPGDRERLLSSGFDAYISKPFTRQSLMEALEAGINAR